MHPKNRTTTHPGEVLLYDCLEPLGMSQSDLARHLGIPVQRVNEIVRGRRGVTVATARMLARAFSTTPEFWLNLQQTYDLTSLPDTSQKVRPLWRPTVSAHT